jgi:soluble lytic murein transglycosylase-like protein
LLFFCAPAAADVGLHSVTRDFDAEFARAADLLEAGRRPEAEQIFSEILQKAGQPAWEARVAFILAAADLRRGDYEAGVERMRHAPAASIGLDAHRHDRLARLLAWAGRPADAAAHWRIAFEAEETAPIRPRIARDLARELEKTRQTGEALAVLEKAAVSAAASDLTALSLERIRLGGVLGKPAAVRAAARDLLLRAPSADSAETTTASVKAVLRREEGALSAADRARRGRALILMGEAKRGVPLILGSPEASWPAAERAEILLALARGQVSLGRKAQGERAAARISREAEEEHAQAVLLRCDLSFERLRLADLKLLGVNDPRVAAVRRALLGLTARSTPRAARRGARERLMRIAAAAGDFRDGIDHALEITREDRGAVAGFEPLWRMAWERYLASDFSEARRRFEALAATYDDIARDRRLAYWRARCLEREGHAATATAILHKLAEAPSPDVYGLFARSRLRNFSIIRPDPLPDPSTATARYRRVDELLRLRLFEEAAAAARALEPTRGRDLRLAEAEFSRGRFLAAATAARRAFPELGTAEEARVPDGWRRLHYPLPEDGSLAEAAGASRLDLALLRGLIRQESVFDAGARSRAGAIGLTQLMPATARTLVKSVLRVRYRRAFLYDPGVNVRLGAAYLRQQLERFGGNTIFALAAYNGGPGRMARVLEENGGRGQDEMLESHPFVETRDYVRRVLLYTESYRALYPR